MLTHFNCNAIISCILTGHSEWYRQHKQSFGALPSKRHKPACSKWLSWNRDEQLWMWTSILHLCWSHCREQVIMCCLVQCHNLAAVASCYWNSVPLNLKSCLFLSKCILYSVIKLHFLWEGTEKNFAYLNINPSCSWLCLKKPKTKSEKKTQQNGPRPTLLMLVRGLVVRLNYCILNWIE